ncbi:biotin--[acetyl-CoA-carboxylase] ligase [Fodinibius sp. Rm-B-1B1-1]|uniref:biotin--[acetyl-CoA-carboxylase] ligase n=1 Tax=Fodinibius alkaliphilus TaxID=3140241 RepID=UPI00315A307E
MSTAFDKSLFLRELDTQWLGQSIRYFDELASTNTYLKKIPRDEIEQGMICLTNHQTKGRGQYEREWESRNGRNLTFSMAFIPPKAERFHVLTLACALAMVECFNELLTTSCAAIKWPNDVLVNDKKTAGILTETVFNGNTFDRLIIGIGLNVNQKNFSAELSGLATSLSLEMEKDLDREQLLATLMQRIEHKYALWQKQGSGLIKSINRNIVGYGQWVGLEIDDELQEDQFKLLGIGEKGQLLMLNREGGIESFSYEQVSLITH